ncbi:unnamed protein product [Rotaria sordida]|uniref:NHL repeat containing protein n=1 Tax=Rotaria sordida TaxID=392033 RepID=A0A818WZS0_9BILA|nr:unnamed protein product [Rotaria sordida]CAF3730640.1 unnamed protein product [Rotaria sordida]
MNSTISSLVSTTTTTTITSVTSTTTTTSTASTTSSTVSSSTTSTTSTTTTTSLFCWNSTAITVAGITSSAGTAANQFDRPFAIALDSSNTLYISDQNNNRVQKWLAGASNGTTVAGEASGMQGIDSSSLYIPSGILLDSSGNIYVADTGNFRVQYWVQGASNGTTVAGITAGASSGTVAAGGNGLGTANTQLKYPVGVYFDASSNSLIIANTGANNVVRWVLGASSWTLIAGSMNGTKGSNATLLNYPVGVTMDSMGNIYVADRNNHRIQFFLAGQSTGITIAGVTNSSGDSAKLLYNPYSIILDAQLNLYVADTYNHRIQKFIHC